MSFLIIHHGTPNLLLPSPRLNTRFLLISPHRRRKQKVRNTSENLDDQLSTELVKELLEKWVLKSASPLVALEYSNGWDPMFDGQNGNGVWPKFFNGFRFNLEEVDSATQYFSESNLLGKNKFLAVNKGVLKDRKNKGKSREITINKRAVLGGGRASAIASNEKWLPKPER
ncbi:hypothetical protein LguiB_011748 [Lonicera macranthoides]